MNRHRKDGVSILGIGVAACAACCAGPILAFLGGVGLAGVMSIVFIGTAGLLIAVAALTALLVVRRRRNACSVPDAPTPVAAPARRSDLSGSTQ